MVDNLPRERVKIKAALGDLLAILEKACSWASQAILFAMMLSISTDGLGRYLFNHPLPGGLQLTELYFMVMLTFLGMPAIYASGGHIRLDIASKWLDKSPYQLSARVNAFVGAMALGLMAWQSGIVAIEKIQELETSFGAVQFPIYLSYVWVPIGSGLLAARMTYDIFFPFEQPKF